MAWARSASVSGLPGSCATAPGAVAPNAGTPMKIDAATKRFLRNIAPTPALLRFVDYESRHWGPNSGNSLGRGSRNFRPGQSARVEPCRVEDGYGRCDGFS